jgi:ferrous-iron efflux pump FieF
MPHDTSAKATNPSQVGRLSPEEAKKITGQVTALAVAVAVILTLSKTFVWTQSGSVSLLASLVDSALDLTASLTVFFAVRYAAEPADDEHRFGHGKAEAFSSVMQAIIVAASAALLLREGVDHLFNPVEIRAGAMAMGVMGLSIVLTLILLFIQTRALEQTGSVAVEGDRAHYLSDLAANIAVIIGIAGSTLLNIVWFDGIVAIGIAVWLAVAAWGVAKGALNQLMDHELPDEQRQKILELAEADARVIDVHQLRTRASGPLVHIQFHLGLAPELTLAEAHTIMVECERRVLSEYPAADILIHADPHGVAESHGVPFFGGESYDAETG